MIMKVTATNHVVTNSRAPYLLTARYITQCFRWNYQRPVGMIGHGLVRLDGGNRSTKSEIRKAFQGYKQIMFSCGDFNEKMTANIIHEPNRNRIEIGCQTFEGIEYIRLRRWALRKP